eukprot:Em0004g1518a
MAKGIKVGSEVRVLRGKFSTQKGVVQASEGVGRARKWIVKLNGGVLERFSARTLELEQRHLITPPSTSIRAVSQEEEDSCSSNTSSDESSTSDNDEMREVDEDGASRRASDVSERRTNWDNRDTAAESNGDDDRVVLDGVEWRKMGDVTVELNGPAYQRKAALYHPLHERSTELDFWKMMMPADLMRNIIEATNLHTEMAQKPLDYEHLQHFFGILLAMTLASGGEQRDMWKTESNGPFPAPALGRYMACHDFERILRNLKLCVYTDEELADDPWLPIRSAVDSFNRNRRGGISPGVTLCADESMGSWRGLAAKVDDAVVGLPHVTKIARKPEGVETEYRTLSCGETKIMLQLEIQEGKVPMQGKEYAKDYGSGTSSLLRLTRYWSGSDRTVVADSAFASLKTAEALHKHRGLRFIGLVKTAHKRFPKAWLQKYPYTNRGDHCVLQANIDGRQYMAVGWNDKKLKMFISSTSRTTEALCPAYKKRFRQSTPEDRTSAPCVVFYKEVKRPAVVEAYFDNANAIDVHNHLRQGGLELERHWKTQTWWHRNFATIFGMCESDAYLAFRYFHPLAPILSHREFTERLSLQLLTYKSSFHDTGPSARLRKHMPVAPTEQPLQTVVAKIMSSHTLKTNMRECPVFQYKRQRLEQDEEGTSHNGRVPSVQRKCSVCCERKTAYYCDECTQLHEEIVPICNPGNAHLSDGDRLVTLDVFPLMGIDLFKTINQQWLSAQKMEGRLCHWALALQEFDFTIKYRRGSSNANADALSRVPTIPSTCAGTVTVPELTLEDVAQEQGNDEVLNEVRRLVSSGLSNQPRRWNQHPIQKFSRIRSQLYVADGVLCRKYTPGPLEKEKIVPVVPLSLQPTVLKANYDIISSGHQGVEKTLQSLKHTAYWIGMAKDMELYCKI